MRIARGLARSPSGGGGRLTVATRSMPKRCARQLGQHGCSTPKASAKYPQPTDSACSSSTIGVSHQAQRSSSRAIRSRWAHLGQ